MVDLIGSKDPKIVLIVWLNNCLINRYICIIFKDVLKTTICVGVSLYQLDIHVRVNCKKKSKWCSSISILYICVVFWFPKLKRLYKIILCCYLVSKVKIIEVALWSSDIFLKYLRCRFENEKVWMCMWVCSSLGVGDRGMVYKEHRKIVIPPIYVYVDLFLYILVFLPLL